MIFQQGAFQLDPNMTPEEIARKREFLRYTSPQYGDADTIGEGIGQLLTGIAHGVQRKRLGDLERTGREKATSSFDRLIKGRGDANYSPDTDSPLTILGIPPSDKVSVGATPGMPAGELDMGTGGDPWAGREDIKNGIFAGESGGDYDALFGFSNRPGGRFDGIKPTEMTAGEVAEFTRPDGEYGQWVKGQVGRVATPVGGYQVVGRTLRDAIANGVVAPGEKFTPAVQDRVGAWVLDTQGTGAWEGYKGPQSGGVRVAQSGQTRNDASELYNALANPWLTPQQKSIIQGMIQRQEQANDPLRQLQIEQARIDVENARNPETFRQVTGDEAAAMGLDPSKAYNIEPSGKVTQIGGGGPTVNNFMGGEPGQYIYGKDAGLPTGWRFDTVTQRAERIPGGPDDVEKEEVEEKQSAKETQERLKLGTSLTSLNLNIGEIENGGLPVTGPIGDFRRTGIGRFLTGSDAFDFGNRTGQITDSAAFSEIQDMRDNSPTGGAVGQLTDKERAAIGNAVTALNSSTSAEEYLRAAKAYRKLSLDLAYGEGLWVLNDDGSVSTSGTPQPERAPTFEQFAQDPSAQAAAEQYGVSLEEMWDIKQGMQQ